MATAYDIQDDHLLELWKKGDPFAFTRFVEKHFRSLVYTAQRRGCELEIAEELAQDVFITLYNNSDVEDNPLAFCRSVLKNKIIDEYRRRKLPVVEPANDAPATGLAGGSGHLMEVKELEQQLVGYIDRLPEQARKVFLLRRKSNLTNQQVADKLGISVKMVEAHMTKAMRLLKEHLSYTLVIAATANLLT
ncbi:sigma-70 family RNA polymerase sigma factor [Niabella sp. W65]|nr:sigma-70 family RNA polymerase sigma factor [Niabella sp. W65]MCH7362804.1 sigma-70 family RNA polymerase sigma factor [Niabella sp. W65]